MARSTAGLTEPDIAELRRQLADGKRPRVQLSGPHFPAGAAGTVVRIGTPDADGADYLRVRVKVNGMLDELAFAPGELSLRRPGRAAKAARPSKASSRTAKAAAPRPSRAAAAVSASRPVATVAEPVQAAAQPAKAAAQPAKAAAQPAKASQPAKAAAQPTKAAAQPAKASQPAKVAAQPAKVPAGRNSAKGRRASAPKVSFTISSSGASWALSGTRGNKNLVRNVALPPGVVSAAAEMFGQPALAEAVSEINDAALAEARARAEQLRAELEQLEEVLATHRRP